MYDIILFENFHSAYRHRFDVRLIAQLLKSKGMDVAILNVYGEEKVEEVSPIPLIEYNAKYPIPDDNSWINSKKNPVLRLFYAIRFLWQQHLYYKDVVGFVSDKAKSLYCGSYHLLMPAAFFKLNMPCFYWGLRSSRMTGFYYHFKKNPFLALRMLYLKHLFFRNKQQCLFVSNDIIKGEFVNLGIDEDRLIIRDERCIDDCVEENEKRKKDPFFSLLIIGGLRKQKRVPLSIRAFKLAAIEGSKLKIVGENKDTDYEECLQEEIGGDESILRLNSRLDYEDFNKYLSQAHFTLFADEKGPSSVTNGTMMESLINYTPIIAPDYPPYSYYVNQYKLGLLYNPDSIGSYSEVIREAKRLGASSFADNISTFLETIRFNAVANKLYEKVKKALP